MKKVFLFIMISSVLMIMCTTDVSVDDADVIGKWNVIKGERNGEAAPYFSGFFIEFKDNNSLVTNINQSSENESGEYSLDKNKIEQQTPSGKLLYDIESFEDATMTVFTQMNGHDLKFVLKRGE